MKARFKYRIYPTLGQKHRLARLVGCVRVVWNDSLACCQEKYKLGKKKTTNSELQKQFITLAKNTEDRVWLSVVSAIPLQQSLNDLNQAYQNFFKSTQGNRKVKPIRAPKSKSRMSLPTARFTKGGFKVGQHKVYLGTIGKLKIVWSRELPAIPSSVTVIRDSANRYFLIFVVEVLPEVLSKTYNSVGIDLGIKTFATIGMFHTTSLHGKKIDTPKPLKKRVKKYRKLSKSLSKKTKGSKRYEKARLKIAKFHAKLKDTRIDFLHKLSTKIIRENQTIVLEDLNISGMVKNRKLSRAISDLGWRKFRTFLEGKAEKYGRVLRVINRRDPTSQTYYCCGFEGGKLDLSIS